MTNLSFKLLFIFVFLVFSNPLWAQNFTKTTDGLIFDANNARFKRLPGGNQLIELDGAVQIIFNSQHVYCESAYINTQEATIKAQGNVFLVGPNIKLQSSGLFLNYKDSTGEIIDGVVQVGQVTFRGRSIKKLGENKYQTIDGEYTACKTCPEDWLIGGSKVDAEIEGYAYIQNSVLYFKNFPVLWLPYLVVPLKSKRQTGLLFPSFEFGGESGFTFAESFFWAMSDHYDSTWVYKNYQNRGTKGLVNFRYLLSKESFGHFDFGYLKDKRFSELDLVRSLEPGNEVLSRWFSRYSHHYELPNNFTHNLNLNLMSDALYPKDFPDELPIRGDSAAENRMSVTHNSLTSHFSIDTSYYSSLLSENPLRSEKDSVHRFPEINWNQPPSNIFDSDMLFHFDVNYINFVRQNNSYDDLDASGVPASKDGEFNFERDLIRTGQRMNVKPEVSYPLQLGKYFDLLPSVSYTETHYRFPIPGYTAAERRYARTNLSLRTKFSKIYKNNRKDLKDAYKHIIQPQLQYTNIPWFQKTSHPFFPDDEFESNFRKDQPISDGDDLQFDYHDRIFEKNLLTFSIVNKVIRKRLIWKNGNPIYKQILNFKLSQSYDFHEANRITTEKKQPWSEITSNLDMRYDFFDINSIAKYYPYQNEVSNSSRIKFFDTRGNYFEMTYSRDFLLDENNSINTTTRTEDVSLGIGTIFKYISINGNTTYNLRLDSLQSFGYSLSLKPPGNCWQISFSQEKPINSDSIIKVNIGFLFDGKTLTGFGS